MQKNLFQLNEVNSNNCRLRKNMKNLQSTTLNNLDKEIKIIIKYKEAAGYQIIIEEY